MEKLYYSKETCVAVHNNINSTDKEEARYERQRTITYGNPVWNVLRKYVQPDLVCTMTVITLSSAKCSLFTSKSASRNEILGDPDVFGKTFLEAARILKYPRKIN
jgi:hypothetical protein